MAQPPLKICSNISLLFQEVDFIDRFSAAADNGFTAVEIQFPYEAEQAKLLQAIQQNNLDVVLINVPAGDLMNGGEGLACVPKRRDDFKRAVEQCLAYAEMLNVSKVNILPGRCLQEDQKERYYDQLLNNLDYAADQFQSVNIGTVFEAINTEDMPNFLIHSTEQMQHILSDINHRNLSMQYDVYHMAKMGEPIYEQLSELMAQIGHIQIADTPHRHEPGSGELDFDKLFALLKSSTYQGWVGAEYKPSADTSAGLAWLKQFELEP